MPWIPVENQPIFFYLFAVLSGIYFKSNPISIENKTWIRLRAIFIGFYFFLATTTALIEHPKWRSLPLGFVDFLIRILKPIFDDDTIIYFVPRLIIGTQLLSIMAIGFFLGLLISNWSTKNESLG